MNYSTAVFLINKNVRGILGVYEDNPAGLPTLFKTLDQTIKKDDLVVVPSGTRHKRTVVKVIDDNADIDFDSAKHVDWTVQKIDGTAYDKIVSDEQAAITTIKAAELRTKREALAESLFKNQTEELKALSLATVNGDPTPAE